MGSGGWLDGKVAVITGAGTGSAAVAARFAAEGGAGDPGRAAAALLHDTVAALQNGTPQAQALAFPADAADPADMARVTEAAATRFGGVDILVANAGGMGAGTAADIADDAWTASIRSNVTTCLVSAGPACRS